MFLLIFIINRRLTFFCSFRCRTFLLRETESAFWTKIHPLCPPHYHTLGILSDPYSLQERVLPLLKEETPAKNQKKKMMMMKVLEMNPSHHSPHIHTAYTYIDQQQVEKNYVRHILDKYLSLYHS